MWKISYCLILLSIFVFAKCQSEELDDLSEDVEKKKGGDGCGHIYDKQTASFHLNVSYLPKKECIWYIKPLLNETKAISLFFHTLLLHEEDTIYFYRSENDTTPIHDTPIRVSNGSITVVTDETYLVVKLTGSNVLFNRTFEAEYDARSPASFHIVPSIRTLYSPIHVNKNATSLECNYQFNKDQHYLDTTSTFIFDQFNFSTSTVKFDGSSLDKPYSKDFKYDIFPVKNPMTITVQMNLPSNETYTLRKHDVDSSCSMHKVIGEHDFENFRSPQYKLTNDSIIPECRWVFEHTNKEKILSVTFDTNNIHFDSPLDIVSINNGASELSPPLLQVTTSNQNFTMNQLIRSNGPYVWIAFKPMTFNSHISGKVKEQGEGGYFKGSGKIDCDPITGNDTVFLLEVESDQIVYLNFTETSLTSIATLSIYDGFDKSNLLATLRGNIWYPVLSQTSKMMIIASGFATSTFKAEFKGVQPGCLHMSTMSNDNYILSGNCNSTCLWVVPPQDRPGSELLLTLQYLSLVEGDTIDISRLDANKTRIGSTIDANVTHVPQLVIPSNEGAIVEINRGSCPKDKDSIILVGHTSYVPACGKNITVDPLTKFQITSPLYPDTYPIFDSCLWKISTPKENLVHLAFNSLNLAPNHCIKVQSSDNVTQLYSGSELPEDIFLSGESTVEFDSSSCGKPVVAGAFQSARGFVVNGTVANCGGILSKNTTGEFTVPTNKTLCIWKVSVPETDSVASENVNIISYTVSKKDATENYELLVYDGSSIREPMIKNGSNSEIWSRTSNLIFIYKKIDATKPSSILSVKYNTISCNATNQCDNKICLHPDWRCNGVNDCLDFSDERNCASVPIPPTITLTGFSSLAFWMTTFIMLATGIVLGVSGPYCYQRYKNGQYRRFGDFSVVQ